ncbi:MAG: diguanylate cyclase [Nitrosomonadales bacterium]|nr:diguanylate cyclase [Nitrosomonadales bacterium]
MSLPSAIRQFQSSAADARQAVREFHAGVAQPEMALVLFFCSSHYDLPMLAEEMRCQFAGVQVVGCTTSGEIGPVGYRERSLSGASFAAGSCVAVSGLQEVRFDAMEIRVTASFGVVSYPAHGRESESLIAVADAAMYAAKAAGRNRVQCASNEILESGGGA